MRSEVNTWKLTEVIIFQPHLPVTSDVRIPIGNWFKPTIKGTRFRDLLSQRKAHRTEERHFGGRWGGRCGRAMEKLGNFGPCCYDLFGKRPWVTRAMKIER